MNLYDNRSRYWNHQVPNLTRSVAGWLFSYLGPPSCQSDWCVGEVFCSLAGDTAIWSISIPRSERSMPMSTDAEGWPHQTLSSACCFKSPVKPSPNSADIIHENHRASIHYARCIRVALQFFGSGCLGSKLLVWRCMNITNHEQPIKTHSNSAFPKDC